MREGGLLVVADTDGARVGDATRKAVRFAQEWSLLTSQGFDLLVLGGQAIRANVGKWASVGAERLVIVEGAELLHPTAARAAGAVASVARRLGSTSVAAASTSFGRDILPRVAVLLELPMLSDVLSIHREEELIFTRPVYAGNFVATVSVSGNAGVFGVRESAFADPELLEKPAEVVCLEASDVSSAPAVKDVVWAALDSSASERPDLGSARVVVSGGRPLRDAATFEKLIGGLADRLGGATGATRAAVDSGVASNEMQVGQTGRTVAPELYIAAGISGSVQHLAGMKDSKTIVAINTDPDAPIFEVADLGLVADLHAAIPEMIERLKTA